MSYRLTAGESREEFKKGLGTAFFDREIHSNLAYRPEFVSNDETQGRRVISTIEKELSECDEFMISVAFITLGGITPLLQILQELEKKNIPGKILTTDYQTFTQPQALEKLNSLKNIELRMYLTDESEGGVENMKPAGFHTKGWIFRQEEYYHIIIGSSNLTAAALKVNKEWNAKLIGSESGEMIRDIRDEFVQLWDSPRTKLYSDCIEDYRMRYHLVSMQKKQALAQQPVPIDQYVLRPNSMQVTFTNNLCRLAEQGEKRALLISATGTGKTYASAFALREMHPKKLLFLVHREQIARQALVSYQRVFGKYRTDGKPYRYEILSGSTSSDLDSIQDADFIFATMQTMRRKEVLTSFSPVAFSEICIDEAHHAGAPSYSLIMEYFKPDFWLGMTASPDSNRFNVYECFDHNIACEIRLQQALEENLLCPFHYFGITDLIVDGKVIGDEDHAEGRRSFARLTSDTRVDYVIRQADYYGHSGNRVKGIIFCSRTKEAIELSKKFNERGLRTIALTGRDGEEARSSALERLAADVPDDQLHDRSRAYDPGTDNGYLDYIFAVDILSEGVDVPEINQVIMLRPTQSAIVFVQQLGRGLRKSEGKEFVVILDFIGNYSSNFLIPIALSGDRSYNKDNVRRTILSGNRIIPGISTIHFDEISRKRIFASIDKANFSDLKLIKENYTQLKNKLGRIPKLMDFDEYGSMDVCRIFDNNNLGSYYKFLEKYEPDYKVRLSADESKVVEFISKKLASGKRIQELELLNRMLTYHHGVMNLLEESLREKYGIIMKQVEEKNVINVMTNQFPSGSGKKTYQNCVFIKEESGGWGISPEYQAMLENQDFYEIVRELVEFGIHRYRKNYRNRYRDTNFVLYGKYTYEDACRLLDWENNVVPLNIGGYKYDEKTKTFPVFINYDKSDNISATTKYEDHFVDESTLIAISKSNRTYESSDVQNFLHAKERGIAVHLFIRKNKDDKISKEYYYLGEMTASGRSREFIMPGTTAGAVEIEWILDTPVREDIFQYIIG